MFFLYYSRKNKNSDKTDITNLVAGTKWRYESANGRADLNLILNHGIYSDFHPHPANFAFFIIINKYHHRGVCLFF